MDRTTRNMEPASAETERPEMGTDDGPPGTDDRDSVQPMEQRSEAPADPEAESRSEPALATADLADARASEPPARTAEATAESTPDDGSGGPLLDEERSADLRSRWESVQVSFVDEPREAVAQADSLVAEVLQDVARSFTTQRESLEKEWQVGDDVSTEELRQALRHYRSFFDRLLSM